MEKPLSQWGWYVIEEDKFTNELTTGFMYPSGGVSLCHMTRKMEMNNQKEQLLWRDGDTSVQTHTDTYMHQENTLGCKHSPNGDTSLGETALCGLWG